jgi:hypothetical protein
MSVERRDAMLAAVESAEDGRERLRLVVKGYVDGGVDPDLLLEDLSDLGPGGTRDRGRRAGRHGPAHRLVRAERPARTAEAPQRRVALRAGGLPG